jgi:hypothetical protein
MSQLFGVVALSKECLTMTIELKRGFLFIATVVCLLTVSCLRVRPTIVYLIDEAIYDETDFVNLDFEKEMQIRQAMAPLFSPCCTVAFSKAGLRSPLEVMAEDGVVYWPSTELYHQSATELGLVYDETRRTYWRAFSGCRAQAGTVSPMRNGIRLTTDGRARIFLHDTAFMGESFIFGRLSLHDVLTHEFIHVGGQPKTPRLFFEHDLANFEFYDEIMEACR